MMRDLFGDVEPLRIVRVIVLAAEKFSKNGVIGFLDTFRFDMPSGKIVLENSNESFL